MTMFTNPEIRRIKNMDSVYNLDRRRRMNSMRMDNVYKLGQTPHKEHGQCIQTWTDAA